MISYRYLCALLGLTLSNCSQRPFSNWFVEEVSKPNCTKVLAIRLTPQYTILDVEFINQGQAFYTQAQQVARIGYLCVSPHTKLTASPGNRTYGLIKAEGIQILPRLNPVDPFEQLRFSLYFDRLENDVEMVTWRDEFVKGHHRFKFELPDIPVVPLLDTAKVP